MSTSLANIGIHSGSELSVTSDLVTGRRTVRAPSGLSVDEQRICELAEMGFAPETIASRVRCHAGFVNGILESSEGELYRDYLVMQREIDMEFLETTWDDLELLATERLAGILRDPASSDSVKLSAVKEVFDRHPRRRLVKVNREEHDVRVRFDEKSERGLMLDVRSEVLGVSG